MVSEFPVGGASTLQGAPTYDFPKISKKQHEIESILGRRGPMPAPPLPRHPNSFDFMQCSEKFGTIVCWRPPRPRGELAPLLGEILDPPLSLLILYM